jgi:hypothetical protein
MINRVFEESLVINAVTSKQAGTSIRPLALPFVGLAVGALPGAAYGALVAFVHLAVSGSLDRTPAFAVGCVAITAAIGLVVGTWLAIYCVRQSRQDGHQPSATRRAIEVRECNAALRSKHTSASSLGSSPSGRL